MKKINYLIAIALMSISCSCSDDSNDNGKDNGNVDSFNVELGKQLPGWTEGCLDINLINTGRGECTFYILPDGTSMLVDAGEVVPNENPTDPADSPVPQKPNATVRPIIVYADYINHYLKYTNKSSIDYCDVTHFHNDHIGDINKNFLDSSNGYVLSGIMGLYTLVKMDNIIDRSYPDYSNLFSAENSASPSSSVTEDYIKFINFVTKNENTKAQKFEVGSSTQFTLKNNPAKYSNFKITNIVSNAEVWDGTEKVQFAAGGENAVSNGFLLTYGKFDWFTAGDLVSEAALKTAESAAGLANGKIDATKTNHHLSDNAMLSDYVAALKPSTIVSHSFYKKQPSVKNLTNILLDKDVKTFFTNIHAETLAENPTLFDKSGSNNTVTDYNGHIVIRVEPGGDKYWVYMLDDNDEAYTVKSIYGPYDCK